jgi:hypothetical protein
MYHALGEEGRMLVDGSLTGEPIRVGADRRLILSGRRILEVFWLGYWFPKLDETARHQLVEDVVALMRDGILVTLLTGVHSPSMRFAQPLHKQNRLAGRERYSLYLRSNRSFRREEERVVCGPELSVRCVIPRVYCESLNDVRSKRRWNLMQKAA